jgi:uncharacterized protein YbjT (DUF2867 family)
MKIVVIGWTGALGSKVVGALRDRGHDAVAASPRTGVNALTGGGLTQALANAGVVVDVANAPSYEDGTRRAGRARRSQNVVVDPRATYFGTPLSINSLVVP